MVVNDTNSNNQKKCRVHKNWYCSTFIKWKKKEKKTLKNIPEQNSNTKRGVKSKKKMNKALVGFFFAIIISLWAVAIWFACLKIVRISLGLIFKLSGNGSDTSSAEVIQKSSHKHLHTKYEQPNEKKKSCCKNSPFKQNGKWLLLFKSVFDFKVCRAQKLTDFYTLISYDCDSIFFHFLSI